MGVGVFIFLIIIPLGTSPFRPFPSSRALPRDLPFIVAGQDSKRRRSAFFFPPATLFALLCILTSQANEKTQTCDTSSSHLRHYYFLLRASCVRLGVYSHTGLINPEEIGFSGPVPKNKVRRMVGLLFIEFNRSLQGEPPEGTDLRSYPSHQQLH